MRATAGQEGPLGPKPEDMTASSSPTSQPPETDGRRLRSEASRARIVAAMIELTREGYGTPPAEAVAERAGVGLRTVFRLFKDMEGLYREMQGVMLQRLAPIAAEPVIGDDWRTQLRSLISRRGRLFEEMMPIKVAADAQRARSPFLQREHAQFVRLQRSIALALIPEDRLTTPQSAEMIDLVMSFDTWRRLRLDQALSVEDAEAVVNRLVEAVLGAP